jgi:flavin-dependent dehydrogenase
VATGLGQSAYEARGVKFTNFYGYWTSQSADPASVHAATYAGDFTNEYAYACSVNGLWYCLLFAKGDVSEGELEKFGEILDKIEGKKITKWGRFTGASVRHPMLFDGNMIFTGTAAGLIEPARGYGIVAALLAGRIAAWAVSDREKAQAEYDKFIVPIKKHVMLKFQEKKDYVAAAFMKPGDIWFDIPTVKSGVVDSEVK